MHRRLFLGLLAILLAGQVACVDINKAGGSTSGTSLYLFSKEGDTQKVYAYQDMEALNGSSETPVPDRTITSGRFSLVVPLAWGGVAMDPANRLYLVGENGIVIRINNVRTQNGAIASNSTDVVSFTLGGSGERLSPGKFGQASFDRGVLYVCEYNDIESRIWKVPNPETKNQDEVVPKANANITLVSGDKACWGVGAGGGNLFAYFNDGGTVGPNAYTGARLRKGFSDGFVPASNVIVGDTALLAKWGSVAVDTNASLVYLARHLQDSGKSGNPVVVYKWGTFTGISTGAPDRQLADASQSAVRVLAHGGNKDWLASLAGFGDAGGKDFWLWKAPSLDTAKAIKRTLPVTGEVEVRGLAFDGNN